MLKFLIKVLLYLCAFVSFIMLLPGSLLLDIHPKAYYYELPKSFDGALKQNNQLSQAAKLFEGEIVGPDSLAVFQGKIVTGARDGYIYQVDGNQLIRLIKLVDVKCEDQTWLKVKCGRPLGMKFDLNGTLFVVEPDLGVFSVENIFEDNPKVNLVLDIEKTGILGKSSKSFNDLTIDESGGLNGGQVLYISDVSTKFDSSQVMFVIGGSEMGRIIKYDINAKTIETIADNLLFPNGLEITDDKSAILFSEYIARQIFKHFIKGPKKGKTEVFLTTLPGEPDNIRRSAAKRETYWIGLNSARNASKPNELDYYLKLPLMRKLLCRFMNLFGSGLELVGKYSGYSVIEEYGYNYKTGLVAMPILLDNPNGVIIEVDISGKVINSLHSPDSTISFISEALEVRLNDTNTVIYLGSSINNFIGKLNLNR